MALNLNQRKTELIESLTAIRTLKTIKVLSETSGTPGEVTITKALNVLIALVLIQQKQIDDLEQKIINLLNNDEL